MQSPNAQVDRIVQALERQTQTLGKMLEEQNTRIEEQNKRIVAQNKETQQLMAAIVKLVEAPTSDPGWSSIRYFEHVLIDKKCRTGIHGESFKQNYGRDGIGDEDIREEFKSRCVHTFLSYTYTNLRPKTTMIGHS